MRAVDTNIIVRFLVADDKAQAAKARAAIAGGDIFIATTVLLESEWILRSAYDFGPDRIAAAFSGLAGLPGVTVEDAELLATTLDWLAGGMDFADALHLARAEGCRMFLSFDRKLAKAAAKTSAIPVKAP